MQRYGHLEAWLSISEHLVKPNKVQLQMENISLLFFRDYVHVVVKYVGIIRTDESSFS